MMDPFQLAKNLNQASGSEAEPFLPPSSSSKEEVLSKVRPVDVPLVKWMADNATIEMFDHFGLMERFVNFIKENAPPDILEIASLQSGNSLAFNISKAWYYKNAVD